MGKKTLRRDALGGEPHLLNLTLMILKRITQGELCFSGVVDVIAVNFQGSSEARPRHRAVKLPSGKIGRVQGVAQKHRQ